MKFINVIKAYFIMGFKEYFLATKTAFIQLVLLPVLMPILVIVFVMMMAAIMLNNVNIVAGRDSELDNNYSSVIGVVLPSEKIGYFDEIKTGLTALPISVNPQLFATKEDADEALVNEKIHVALIFTSLSPLTIEMRSHSQKQTVYRHVLNAMDSYDLSNALMPLRRQLVLDKSGIDETKLGEVLAVGQLTKKQIGEGETPLFALVIVGLFWVGAVMYPVSIAKMGLIHTNDITSDDLSHCLSLRLPPLYYVLSRVAGAYAVYLPASIVMFSVIFAYLALVKIFLLSPYAAPFYSTNDIHIVIEQYLGWSTMLFSFKVVVLLFIIVTLGVPMLLMNLLIHFFSKDERSAVTYSSYLDTVSYAFPAFAALVSASVPTFFGSLPLLQQYYLLRAFVVDDLSSDFLVGYGFWGAIFTVVVVVIASRRAYDPNRWVY